MQEENLASHEIPGNNIWPCSHSIIFLKKYSSWKIKFRKHAQAGAETKLLSATTWTHSCFHCCRSWMAAEGKWRTYEFFYFIHFEQNNAGSIHFPGESVDIWVVILLSAVMAPLGNWLLLLLFHKLYIPEAATFTSCHQYGNSHSIISCSEYMISLGKVHIHLNRGGKKSLQDLMTFVKKLRKKQQEKISNVHPEYTLWGIKTTKKIFKG